MIILIGPRISMGIFLSIRETVCSVHIFKFNFYLFSVEDLSLLNICMTFGRGDGGGLFAILAVVNWARVPLIIK